MNKNLFDDERCKFKNGSIQVQTEYPYYEPGQTVNGKIFMQIHSEMKCTEVEMEVKGKTGTAFKWFRQEVHEHEEEDAEGNTVIRYEHETIEEKAKHAKKFLDFKGSVFTV